MVCFEKIGEDVLRVPGYYVLLQVTSRTHHTGPSAESLLTSSTSQDWTSTDFKIQIEIYQLMDLDQ